MKITTFFLLFALLLSACTPVAVIAPANQPTSYPKKVADVQEVKIGETVLEIHCYGSGEPTVVLEDGLSSNWAIWGHVYQGLPPDIRVCAYNRSYKTHTSLEFANDLHNLLMGAGLKGPFILVGYTFGASIVSLYAQQYPTEVAGIVFVNGFHPDQFARLLSVLPAENPGDSPDLVKLRQWLQTPTQYAINLPASMEQYQGIKTLGDLPLYVITSPPPGPLWRDIPTELKTKLDQEQQTLQKELTRLSTRGTQVMATNPDPLLQIFQPQVIIDTINALVKTVRGK